MTCRSRQARSKRSLKPRQKDMEQHHVKALLAIAEAQREIGKEVAAQTTLAQAFAVAREIPEYMRAIREEALGLIVEAQTKCREWAAAVATAKNITDNELRTRHLTEIRKMQPMNGQHE